MSGESVNPQPGFPSRRVIVLGASNVARALSTVVETSRAAWGSPLDFMGAFGHGRSYGVMSRVLVRTLEGIRNCALWEALRRRPPAETAAVVTDIGNDLIYGFEPEKIVAFVDQCLVRLSDHGARIVMTQLPIGNIEHVTPAQYRLVRTVLFPTRRLSLETVSERAFRLGGMLEDLARTYGATLVDQPADWYGFDPIHHRIRTWRRVWGTILGGWSDNGQPVDGVRGSLGRYVYLRSLAPHRRWICGIEQRKQQPAGSLPDGTLLSFF